MDVHRKRSRKRSLWFVEKIGNIYSIFFFTVNLITYVLTQATKENATETASQGEEDKQEEEIDEVDGDGRRRRKRKVPKRFKTTDTRLLSILNVAVKLLTIYHLVQILGSGTGKGIGKDI